MTNPTRRAWATIDRSALKKNLAQVRARCPESGVIPVVKSNAYGHGMEQLAPVLAEGNNGVSALAVATLQEALALRELVPSRRILFLNGFIDADELALCLQHSIEPVVHSDYQLELLEQLFSKEIVGDQRRLWLKCNTGMNRLGFSPEAALSAYRRLHKFPGVDTVLMSHLAWADEPQRAEALEFTASQLALFDRLREQIKGLRDQALQCSFAASAGILTLPAAHHQYVRPGIMLYGSSPLSGETGEEIGLQPVMTLSSRLIAINEVSAGQSIGYGATYTCDRDTRVGVVSIGYGDGYPRAAVNGTPVLLLTSEGPVRTRLLGRVSMDMITIDVTGIAGVGIDTPVVLWGEGLCADEIAASAGTIAYELFCKVTSRVERIYQ